MATGATTWFWVADSDRTTEGLTKLIVETPAGRVPLSSFAQVVETDGPNQIQRDNTRRRIVVLANTDGTDMARIIGEIRALLSDAKLPAGYSTALEGAFQAQEEASRLIALLSLVSLGAIFISCVLGTCVTVTLEGRRPLVAEVQTLVCPVNGNELCRRVTSGLAPARVGCRSGSRSTW
jgi:hypothetical protein